MARGARPKAPAVIVPAFGPIRHACTVQDTRLHGCPADAEAGLFVWTNKGKAGPHGATGRQEFGVFCLTKGRERPQDANSELSLFTELANSKPKRSLLAIHFS
jgi:hypothetical protein